MSDQDNKFQCAGRIMSLSSTGGLRDNLGKPRLSLVPLPLITGVAEVIWKSSIDGGGKYPMWNWQNGLPWLSTADSAIRHIYDFVNRRDLDRESGLHTLKHAATNVAFLLTYLETHPELDDRQKK